MMLPPVGSTTLSANPKFETLYRDLCTNKLNPDGSSVLDAKVQKERDIFATDLRIARLEGAKRNLIRSELRVISSDSTSLPDDLQELVAIAAATLDGRVPEDDLDLVQEYVNILVDNPSRVAAAVEQNLNRNATALAKVISPNTKIVPTKTPETLAELSKSVAAYKTDLAATRLDITHESGTVHELYRQVLANSIRLLEQEIHGSVSRASKAKADYLAVVAEGMAKKLGIQHQQLLSQIYSNDLQELLQERSEELSREDRSIRRKLDQAQEKLQQYRAGRGMEGMANEYAEILSETARVREEIARLESRQISA
ncbi:hypothetical protein MBLNU13_g01285t1 [Cladosporium sp. NU13]